MLLIEIWNNDNKTIISSIGHKIEEMKTWDVPV